MRVVLKHAPGRSIRSVAVLALLALAPGAIALSSDGSPADEPAEFRAYDASSAGAPPLPHSRPDRLDAARDARGQARGVPV